MAWLYVPESADSNSAYTLPWASDIKLCVTLSGTATQRRLSWRGWKARVWVRRLYGTILNPSTESHGADSWISSLRDTRVSRSASPVNEAANAIRGIYGPMFDELSAKYSRESVFSKTSGPTYQMDLIECGPTFENLDIAWKTTVASLRSDCLRRRKWARRIGGNGCSLWPTAAARDVKNGEASQATLERNARPLNEVALEWQTPSVSDITGGHATRGGARSGETLLPGQAVQWNTPMSRDGGKQSAGKRKDCDLSRQARRIWRAGGSTSEKRVLSPLFVEALMGFPRHWSIATTGYGVSEMELCRWLRRMRSCLYWRVSMECKEHT